MVKIALIIVAVVIADLLLFVFALTDVDQVGVARAYRAYGDNPTEENLQIREARFSAASEKEAQKRGFSLVAILIVTSGGAFIIGRRFERQRHQAPADDTQTI